MKGPGHKLPQVRRYRSIEASVAMLVGLLVAGLAVAALVVALAGCGGKVRPVPVKPTPQIETHCEDECPCPGCVPCVRGKCVPPPVPPGGAP